MNSLNSNPNYIKKNISIILQGPLHLDNIKMISFHCEHWRSILPEAEIILSISTSDFLSFLRIDKNNSLKKKIINTSFSSYIDSINKNCDHIVFNEYSSVESFPPIKDDTTSPNNVNYLIESSKNGLSTVNKKFCLRIRNDSFFENTNFISIYCSHYNLPRRSETSVLRQRVLVPWMYTLNPFSKERLPLHVSDWLNFGLTEDIKKIWDIPFYTYEDSIFFRKVKKNNMNSHEKHFYVRLAVEQHIYYHAFKKFFPELEISYINDLSSVSLSIDIIIDNFLIFSGKNYSFIIKKSYQEEFHNYYNRSSFITGDAWKFLCLHRNIKYKRVLKGNVDRNIKKLSKNTFPVESFEKGHSPFHKHNSYKKKIIYFFFLSIMKKKMKLKFLRKPEKFFEDSKIFLVKKIGKFYLYNE